VVSTPVLAAGPARAAIVVHEEDGVPRFGVAVRSLRSGACVIYELDEDLAADASGCEVALDAALTFGESMGFLFDDDALASADPHARRRALAALAELLGDAASEAPEALAPAPSAEILLEDVDADLSRRADSGPLETSAPAPPLSKFRRGAAAVGPCATERLAAAGRAAAAPAAEGRAVRPGPGSAAEATLGDGGSRLRLGLLGRLRPLRRRSRAAEDARPASPLLRLLSWF
jgi:hypothetical protein